MGISKPSSETATLSESESLHPAGSVTVMVYSVVAEGFAVGSAQVVQVRSKSGVHSIAEPEAAPITGAKTVLWPCIRATSGPAESWNFLWANANGFGLKSLTAGTVTVLKPKPVEVVAGAI